MFAIIGGVRRALLEVGDEAGAKDFVARALRSKSYDEALGLVTEYVDAH